MIKKIVLGVALAGLVGVLVFGAVGRTDARLDTGTAEGRSAQGYGQPGGDGPNDQQGGPRHGQADGRAQEGPYDADSGPGYGQDGNQGPPQEGCDGDCDGDDPDHDQQGGRRSDTARAGLGQGQGGSRGGGAGRGTAEGGEMGGTGQAQVGEWVTLEGVVTGLDGDAMVVSAANGEILEVSNRAWRFAQEQGFTANVGDDVILLVFYDGDKLEVGRITDSSSEHTVSLRDESGRPLWAGRGNHG
jgi:hypothetical protein